ncbi:MAG: hypothetical protein Q9219_002658 [cf. Caloplaca sp. 3 TL-2023]
MDTENIIDVAGDGVIPTPSQEYRRVQKFRDTDSISILELMVISNNPTGPVDHRMTYGILHDALVGLWDVMIKGKRERSLQYFKILHTGKGTVGLGYVNFAHRPDPNEDQPGR